MIQWNSSHSDTKPVKDQKQVEVESYPQDKKEKLAFDLDRTVTPRVSLCWSGSHKEYIALGLLGAEWRDFLIQLEFIKNVLSSVSSVDVSAKIEATFCVVNINEF